jgi:hypothetical protein
MVQVTDIRDSMPIHGKHRTVTRQDIALLQDSYPGFLAKKVFINMPLGYLVANMIINMIMSTLDTQHILSKFVFASSVKSAEILFRYITPEQVLVQSGGLFKQEDPEFATSDAVTELTIQASSKEIIEIPAENSTIVWVLRVLGWEVSYAADFTPDLDPVAWCFSWSSRLPWPHPSDKSSNYVAEIKFQKPTLALSLNYVVIVLMVRSKDSMGLSFENKSSGTSSKGNTVCLFGVSELLAQEDSLYSSGIMTQFNISNSGSVVVVFTQRLQMWVLILLVKLRVKFQWVVLVNLLSLSGILWCFYTLLKMQLVEFIFKQTVGCCLMGSMWLMRSLILMFLW